jgi:hypothetical protein
MKDAQAIEIARGHSEEISRIMGMIGEKRFLSRPEKEDIQQQFKELKAALERDKKAIESYGERLTPCVAGFKAAIRQTESELSPLRSNTDPINSGWHGKLAYARVSLDFFLSNHGGG